MYMHDEETQERRPHSSVDDRIEDALLKSRRIFFSEAVDEKSTNTAIKKLWYLEYLDPGKPILFVINSPGGAVDCGFAIWDQVKMIKSPVTTLVTGLAASMGSILSLCAAPGRRFATKHSRIMIHQPRVMGLIQGQATDLEIQAKEILKTWATIVDVYVEATGKDRKAIEKAIDRDTWMSAHEAVEFGLLDKVVESYAQIN